MLMQKLNLMPMALGLELGIGNGIGALPMQARRLLRLLSFAANLKPFSVAQIEPCVQCCVQAKLRAVTAAIRLTFDSYKQIQKVKVEHTDSFSGRNHSHVQASGRANWSRELSPRAECF